MMMWQITKIIIVIELVIGMLDGAGLFDQNYWQTNQASTDFGYTTGSLSDLMKSNGQVGITGMDWFTQGVAWAFLSFIWILAQAGMAVVVILPTLINRFHVPMEIATVIQGLIYLEYGWGFAQWRAQRPGRSYE